VDGPYDASEVLQENFYDVEFKDVMEAVQIIEEGGIEWVSRDTYEEDDDPE
jgi:hypothetical protein